MRFSESEYYNFVKSAMAIADLARRSGLYTSTVDDIVNHRISNPSIATLKLIAYGFEMDFQTFIDFPEFKNLTFEEMKSMRSKKKVQNEVDEKEIEENS